MLAVVPTQWRSSAPGSSTSLLRCRSTPIGRCVRAACCAAARERLRPTVIGSTTPGKRTTLRTGNTMSASSGRARPLRSSWPRAASACTGTAFGSASALTVLLFLSISVFMFAFHLEHLVPSAPLEQRHNEAAVHPLPRSRLQRHLRQRNTPLEPSIGNLQPPDRARAVVEGNAALGADQQAARVVARFHAIRRDPGQRDDHGDLALVLEHVHGRLPRGMRLRLAETKKLAVQALRLLDHL